MQSSPLRQMSPAWLGEETARRFTTLGWLVSMSRICANFTVHSECVSLGPVPRADSYHATSSTPLAPAAPVAKTDAPLLMFRPSTLNGVDQCAPWSLLAMT